MFINYKHTKKNRSPQATVHMNMSNHGRLRFQIIGCHG